MLFDRPSSPPSTGSVLSIAVWLCRAPGVTRVAVTGELDIATSPQLRAALSRPPDGTVLVILDLSEVTFIDATGLRVILGAHGRLRGAGCHLVLIPGPRAVQRLFEITGTEGQLDFLRTSTATTFRPANSTTSTAGRKSRGLSAKRRATAALELRDRVQADRATSRGL